MPNSLDILKSRTESEVAKLRLSYREKLARSLSKARQYYGSEPQYKDLLGTLIDLENWLVETFGTTGQKKLTAEDEKDVSVFFHNPKLARSINDILELAAKKFNNCLKDRTSEEIVNILQKLNILQLKLNGVILRPDYKTILKSTIGGEWEKKLLMPRLEQLISFLNKLGIYTDDLIVCSGELNEHQMREVTYYLVEIPKLNCQILVCNQVGEATFVINGIFDRQSLLTMSKEELQEKHGNNVIRIIYKDPIRWEEKLEEALLKGKEKRTTRPNRKKVDVKSYEEIRNKLREIYSPKDWLAVRSTQKREIGIGKYKYSAICTIFGIVTENPFVHENHIELAGMIFGENCPEVQKTLSELRVRKGKELELGEEPEKWKSEIKKFYTFEQWIALSSDEREEFSFFGKSLNMLGLIFGKKREISLAVKKEFLELALIIYGDSIDIIKRQNIEQQITELTEQREARFETQSRSKKSKSPDGQKLRKINWIEEVKAKITAKKLVEMPSEDLQKTNVRKFSLAAIARFLGILETHKWLDRKSLIAFGEKVFGADDPDIKKAKEEFEKLEDPIKLASALREKYTIEEWTTWDVKTKRNFRYADCGLVRISGIFGMPGDPVSYQEIHLKTGAVIFEPAEVEKHIKPKLLEYAKQEALGEDIKEWRQEIKIIYTRAQWTAIRGENRRKVFIHGRGISFLGRTFGIEGNILGSNENFDKLTAKIYDEPETNI